MGEEVVFVHDDLAAPRGPVFPPAFYDRWIYCDYYSSDVLPEG